jgi:hypothetical protein
MWLFLWRSTCFDCRAENCNRHKINLVLVIWYFENGQAVFVEILRIWSLINSESNGVKIVKNACQEPEILFLKLIVSGVLTNLPILVSKWCQDCQIAIKFIRDTQKGVGLAVVELICYFIALYADNVINFQASIGRSCKLLSIKHKINLSYHGNSNSWEPHPDLL